MEFLHIQEFWNRLDQISILSLSGSCKAALQWARHQKPVELFFAQHGSLIASKLNPVDYANFRLSCSVLLKLPRHKLIENLSREFPGPGWYAAKSYAIGIQDAIRSVDEWITVGRHTITYEPGEKIHICGGPDMANTCSDGYLGLAGVTFHVPAKHRLMATIIVQGQDWFQYDLQATDELDLADEFFSRPLLCDSLFWHDARLTSNCRATIHYTQELPKCQSSTAPNILDLAYYLAISKFAQFPGRLAKTMSGMSTWEIIV
jgi:hypothetical protein